MNSKQIADALYQADKTARIEREAQHLGYTWGLEHDDSVPFHDERLVKLLEDNKDASEIHTVVAWRRGYSKGDLKRRGIG